MSLRLPPNWNLSDSPHDPLGNAGPATHRALDQESVADPKRGIRLVRVRVEVLFEVGHAALAWMCGQWGYFQLFVQRRSGGSGK